MYMLNYFLCIYLYLPICIFGFDVIIRSNIFVTSSYIALIIFAVIGTINVTGTENGSSFNRTGNTIPNNQLYQKKVRCYLLLFLTKITK
jgi:hypothetical protein